MADNVTLPGSGKSVATDDIAGQHFQRVKLIHGSDGVNIGDVATGNGLPVQGDSVHDSVDAGNPIKIGGKAKPIDGTEPGSPVAENDRVNFIADLYGRQLVSITHPNSWEAKDNQAAPQTNKLLVLAPGVGLSLYITDIILSNGATVGTIKLLEDIGGAPVEIMPDLYFAVNGGAIINLNTEIKLSANVSLGYTSTSVTTHSVKLLGFTAP